jgi:hypothetical protein
MSLTDIIKCEDLMSPIGAAPTSYTIIHAFDDTLDDSLPFIGRLAEINRRLPPNAPMPSGFALLLVICGRDCHAFRHTLSCIRHQAGKFGRNSRPIKV